MADLRALTVRQPWAWAIAKGFKDVENRSWTTTYRGPMVIHAAKAWDDRNIDALREVVGRAREQGVPLPTKLADDLPYSGTSHVIAVVDLVEICTVGLGDVGCPSRCDCGPWAIRGEAHWRLANARLLTQPVPMKGRLGLFTPPAEVLEMVEEEDRG